MPVVYLTPIALETMVVHAIDSLPCEAFGLLSGYILYHDGIGVVEKVYPHTKAQSRRTEVAIDERYISKLSRCIDDLGNSIIGDYHSHPYASGMALRFSEADLDTHEDDNVYLLVIIKNSNNRVRSSKGSKGSRKRRNGRRYNLRSRQNQKFREIYNSWLLSGVISQYRVWIRACWGRNSCQIKLMQGGQ